MAGARPGQGKNSFKSRQELLARKNSKKIPHRDAHVLSRLVEMNKFLAMARKKLF